MNKNKYCHNIFLHTEATCMTCEATVIFMRRFAAPAESYRVISDVVIFIESHCVYSTYMRVKRFFFRR